MSRTHDPIEDTANILRSIDANLAEILEVLTTPKKTAPGGGHVTPIWLRETFGLPPLEKPFVFCPYCGQRLAVIFDAHRCGTSDID